MVTAEELRAIFDYDAKSGVFVRKVYRSANARQGQRVKGATAKNGYRVVNVNGKVHYMHRLVWVFHHGDVLNRGIDIDHINGDRSDNRIENLRAATRSQNNINRSRKSNNSSGVTGVFRRRGNSWVAAIGVGGVMHFSQHVASKREAVAARIELERKFYDGWSQR